MKDLIKEKLTEIEETYDVKILFAVESGSRAWGFPSKDSDYDVRFIYIHKPQWYLAIDPQGIGGKRDVIELPINDLLDFSGWEITKALRLYRKSNPPLLEWLKSEIIYYQNDLFVEKMRALESEVFYPNASMHHYLNMATAHFHGHLQSPLVKSKKYFYALRPVLACKWIEKNNSVPPIDFQELMAAVLEDPVLIKEIGLLLERKKAGDELAEEPRIQRVHRFLEMEIIRLEAYIKTLPAVKSDPTRKLDELFRQMMDEAYFYPQTL